MHSIFAQAQFLKLLLLGFTVLISEAEEILTMNCFVTDAPVKILLWVYFCDG